MENQTPTASQPKKRRQHPVVTILLSLVALFIGTIIIVLAVIAFNLASGRARINYTNCTTAGEVASDTIRALSSNFENKEFSFSCALWFAWQESSSDDLRPNFDLTFRGKDSFSSLTQVESQVNKKMKTTGWHQMKGSKSLVLKRGDFRYEAEIKPYSYKPALVFVKIKQISGHKGEPNFDQSLINNIYPEKKQSDQAKLRQLTYQVYTSNFVPSGYTAWQSYWIDYQEPYTHSSVDANYELKGGAKESVKPQLRSQPLKNADAATYCKDQNAARLDCILFATTSSGMKLYVEPDQYTPNGQGDMIYAVKGGTLLTLYYAVNYIYLDPKISNEDVVKIFEGLKPVNTPAKY